VSAWKEIVRRLAHLGRRARFDRELDEEMAFHVDARADELEASGLTRAAAVAAARREFGSRDRARESVREAWSFRMIEDAIADLRYALRAFRRSPAFTVTAVVSLALGIGANSTMFAALDAILWKPLPVADPASLVRLSLTRAEAENTGVLPLEYVERLRGAGIFADLITVSSDGLSFGYDDRAERIVGAVVSPNFFSFVGVSPVIGRGFSDEAQNGGWAPEAVLSYRFWQRRFAGNPGVIGATIRLNTVPFTIVGVAPESFFDLTPGYEPELRLPILPTGRQLAQMDLASGAPARRVGVMARLRPSTTPASAEAAADNVLQDWLRTTSLPMPRAPYRHVRVQAAATGFASDVAQFRTPMFVLLALVGLVLLIACVNVASMLLARGLARHREMALRASIGAGRARLVRQLLTESVLLAAAGGVGGIAVAYWAVSALVWFLPQGHISFVVDVRPDGRVLAFTSALSMVTGIVFGLLPAVQATRDSVVAGLKAESAGLLRAAGSGGVRKALVIVQVAFSLLLLIAAGWFVRALSSLRPLDFHAPADRVVLFTMKPQREIYGPDRMRSLVGELQQRIGALPGVRSASFAEFGPLGSRTDNVDYESDDRTSVHGALDLVSPRFFETVGLPLMAGRDFEAGDRRDTPPVAIVNEALARALFHGATPIGRRVRIVGDPERRLFEVVGVAATTHYYDLHTVPAPAAWIALAQETPYMPTLHVRSDAADTAAVVSAVRREFDAVDKGFPIFNIKTLADRIDDSLSRERMVATLSAVFGGVALLLAGVGLYGILAYSVSRRQREIGIRMALGSTRRAVLWLVAREAAFVVAAGAVAGTALATLAGPIAARYLYGIAPYDLGVVLGSAAAMAVIALVAASIPASRAAQVEPVRALRSE
jgi:predicted permease